MVRLFVPVVAALVACLLAGVPAPAQEPPPPPPPRAEEELVEKVRRTIDNGVKFLRSKQAKDGTWEGVVINLLADMEGGGTALVTLALLNCGVKPEDPAVARAIDYLRKLPPKKTYVVGLQNLVFAEARQAKDLPLIKANADWLIAQGIGWTADKDGRVTGGKLEGWSYPGNQIADNSNTQYALLGLYAAKSAGARIDDSVWKAVQEFYTRTQQPDTNTSGYWSYYNPQFGDKGRSISMSVAGVCGLLIARMGLDESEQRLNPATGVAANCGQYGENTALARGMNWVGTNFTFESLKSTFYNIYGIERLGRLSGQRFIGKYDWYREGCEKLIRLQQADGSIIGGKGIDSSAVLSTSFGLLFLSKGRTPVLISKFAWGDFQARGDGAFVEIGGPNPGVANWNRKHNDTRHLVEFCSKELFGGVPLSWQAYDVRRRDLSDKQKILEEVGLLLQSPVLYLNGHGKLLLTDAQEEVLKTYVEEGGFLVAEACCGDPEFAASFRTLVKKLFAGATLRKMPPEHAIWKMFPGVTPLDFPEVEVLDRGCRTVAVFSPVPLAGYWEEAKYIPKDGRNPANRGEKAFCLARNVVAYATGMELPKPKLTRTNLVLKGPEVGVTRSHFKALQLQVGDTPPAPDALRNLMGYLRDNARLEVALTSAVLPPSDEQVLSFKFMYVHGRKPINLSETELETLQANLQTGGLLLADAACGGYEQWKAFDASFRETCRKLFPNSKLVVIQERDGDKEDGLFKVAREAGINIRTVRCRRELPGDKGPEPEMRNYPVLLEGIKIDGRWVVVYSRYDLGCAIEGHKAADCLGHDKDSALRVAAAVALYSLKR